MHTSLDMHIISYKRWVMWNGNMASMPPRDASQLPLFPVFLDFPLVV